MNLEEMKELYKTGEWICAAKWDGQENWIIRDNPSFNTPSVAYRLIHKKHEKVLNQYFEKKYEIGLNGSFIKDFIETYNPDHNYNIMYLYPIK